MRVIRFLYNLWPPLRPREGSVSRVKYIPGLTRNKEMGNPAEEWEKPDSKGLAFEQNALYHAYASKSPEWHRDMTKRLLHKVDWHLLPFLILMYLLNFLDRK